MTPEELGAKLVKDDRFKALPPERQKIVFKEAVSRLSSSEQPQEAPAVATQLQSPVPTASLSPARPLSVQEMFPATAETGREPMSMANISFPGGPPGRAMYNMATQDIPNLANRAVSYGMERLRGNQRPLSAEMRGGNVELQSGQPSKLNQAVRNVPGEIAQMVIGAKAAPRVAELGIAAAQAPFKSAAGSVDFLRGNPKKIDAASRKLDEVATNTVHRLRNRGDLQARVFDALANESNKAWAPMNDLASAIPGKIPTADVRAIATQRLAAEPERLQALNTFLDALDDKSGYILPRSGRAFGGTASDWSDLSSEIGTFLSRGAHKGASARTMKDVMLSDIRNAVADVLEARAPMELKGSVVQAKLNWADYASDRDRLFSLFKVGASPNYPAKSGANFLKRAAQGRLSTDERMFMDRLKGVSGLDLPASIKPYAEALNRAKSGGDVGKKVTKGLSATGALIGAGAGLKYVSQ